MPSDPPSNDLMRYDLMQQDALRGVVKAALKRISAQGLPGAHHFYVTFKTAAAGVSGPADLLGEYPDEMTIVLQNQFWDLAPGETFFSVTLKFKGQPKRLSVPYSAVTRFYDPSVQYLLQFEAQAVEVAPEPESKTAPTAVEPPPADDDDGPKVVQLDQFRKK